ncbi:hypothetical protein SAMN05444008_11633 [Cnuella takakiae]|uniref:Uncharacterized protein n=1 Tax=Cnuella takakiae TaxID=1302690 RepID=A0A1M5GDT9_9BACT|nr:hypothetical protein [Cnuella takakiae]OLY92381.1 hypothetical protein BUE76_11130 [Cnuella takakiae]SHG01849.1 hypothetical protein SAMN05444008_11633 [Cnuella takakiae]
MSKERQENFNKERKSDARKEFEEQDNAGRFAGEDLDAQAARAQAEDKIRQVEGSLSEQHTVREVIPEDAPPPMDGAQPNNEGSEAQNVSTQRADAGQLLNNDRSMDDAIGKANQGGNR